MTARIEDLFLSFRENGDTESLGAVFDRTAPRLLRTALHLARDPSHAEDALQATYLTAIQKAADYDPERPLEPWLLGILTRHVARLTSRVRLSETEMPDECDIPERDPVAVAEHSELKETLRRHVEELPDKYRQVLLLRLLHDLEPAEIAEVLGLAPGTVRMRVHRGLSRLRASLPAGVASGALAAVLLSNQASAMRGLASIRAEVLDRAVTHLPTTSSPAAPAPPPSGWLFGAAGAGLLCVGLGAWWLGTLDAAPPTAQPRVLAEASTSSSSAQPAERELESEPVSRAPLATFTEASASGPEQAWSLEVLVTTAGGQPAGGVGVRAVPELAGREPTLNMRYGVTDASGWLRFDDLLSPIVDLRTDRGPVMPLRFYIDTDEQPARLGIGNRELRVKVVDNRGTALGGAEVFLSRPQPHEIATSVGITNGNGEFHLVGLAGRPMNVCARAPGLAPSALHPVRRHGNGEVLELRLGDQGGALAGTVRDNAGRPVAGACVFVEHQHWYGAGGPVPSLRTRWAPLRTTTDHSGHYTFPGLVGDCDVRVTARAQGFAPSRSETTVPETGTSHLDLILAPGAEIAGTVRTAAGQPVANAEVGITDTDPFWGSVVRADDQGRFWLSGLSPGRLRARAGKPGSGTVTAPFELTAGEQVTWNPVLTSESSTHGRLIDSRGRGIQGYEIRADNAAHHDGALGRRHHWVRSSRGGNFRSNWQQAHDDDPLRFSVRSPGGVWVPCTTASTPVSGLIVRVPDAIAPTGSIVGSTPAGYRRLILERPTGIVHRLGLKPGPLRIPGLAPGEDYHLWLPSTSPDQPPIRLGPLSVQANCPCDIGTIPIPDNTARVALVATRSDGRSLRSGSCRVRRSDGRLVARFPLDEGGRGTCPLTPGDYLFEVDSANSACGRVAATIAGSHTEVAFTTSPATLHDIVIRPKGGGPRSSVPDMVHQRIETATGETITERGPAPIEPRHPFSCALVAGRYAVIVRQNDGSILRGVFIATESGESRRPIFVEVE